MLEKQIEAAVCKYAESQGFLQFKFSSPGHWAVPDRIFFGDLNCVFLIEFKRQGGKPTAAQEREATRLRMLGPARRSSTATRKCWTGCWNHGICSSAA